MLSLPRSLEGKPYISYSQYTNWRSKKSFNMGIEGRYEYMLNYMFDHTWADMGWAEFGNQVEDYICERRGAENFEEGELQLMDSITPLGVFQKQFLLEFDEFYLLGFIDDATEDFKHIRDYKTCSKNSSKKYYGDEYYQLDIYAMWVKQEFGYLPDTLEVCMIERTGNPFKGGGRSVLKVGENVWYHRRETTPERQQALKNDITKAAHEIAEFWTVYQKLLKL